MSATSIETARIAGAIKGLDALRTLKQAANGFQPNETTTAHYRKRLSDALSMAAALGLMTPEQEGAVAVLAEYIHAEITGISLDISPGHWIPLLAMTKEEREAMIETMQAEADEVDAEWEAERKARRKVVSIADYRIAQ